MYRFFILGLAAALSAACAVNEADHSTPVIDDGEEFFASIEGAATRVYVDDELRVLWNADDRVSIFNRITYNRQYRFDGVDGDNSGTFKKVPTDDFVMSNPLDYVYSVYPYNENTKISNDGVLTVYLPAEQSYREDTFGLGANTMIAVADDNELMFKNLCGYVTLRLYGTDVSVTSISLKGNRNEPLAGKATVTAGVEAAPELQMDASATQEVTLNMDAPVTLGTTAETATTFWLVVPPTTFEGGITLLVKTADGKQFEKSTTGILAISRNTRSKMAALEVVPEIPPFSRYLTFTSEGTTKVSFTYNGVYPLFYYSTDKKNWSPWESESELTFSNEQPLFICGDNPRGFESSNLIFVAKGDLFAISGDVMSLIDDQQELTSIPSKGCFDGLFSRCPGLTSAPELPATELTDHCYYRMFIGCKNLAAAPELPATTLAQSCYELMFSNCSGLKTAPELPATTLAQSCYNSMFSGCIGLTAAPELPATTLAEECYSWMFSQCFGLTTVPELPATTLAKSCYFLMFNECSSLTVAPELPATTLTTGCYENMFYNCTALTKAPELPATELADYCYHRMFGGCRNLRSAPELPAATLVKRCYAQMFSGCSHLNQVKCLATDISATGCLDEWLDGVASTGTFVKASGMNAWPTGRSGIPVGWTVEDDNEFDCRYLTFTSEGRTTVSLCNYGENAPVLFYSTDRTHWTQWDYSELTFTNGQPLYICGDNPEGVSSTDPWGVSSSDPDGLFAETRYSQFVTSGDRFSVSGNIMSLIDSKLETTVIPSDYCFSGLFDGCRDLTAAPDLPATTLADGCYSYMFSGCTGLTATPDLPATTLADGCYRSMFVNCTGLTAAQDLPATTLADDCYSSMFSGCTGLATAPNLPATTLAYGCYSSMFSGCTGLTSAPDLPATTLTGSCYSTMFIDCTGLTSAPDLPATTLASSCYYSMFIGCTGLTTAPDLPATTLASSCYRNMFSGCTGLTIAPDLPATTLAEWCYSSMFSRCTKINHIKCLATDISATNCVSGWLSNVASTGTFVKAPGMNDWPAGASGIPEGWTVREPLAFNKYLTFSSEGKTKVYLRNNGGNAPVLYYSTDKMKWTQWDYSELTFSRDRPLYICGDNPDGFSSYSKYSSFETAGDNFGVSGDVMSLLDTEHEVASIPSDYCFYGLFLNSSGLTVAPDLSATKLAHHCYSRMFSNCTDLKMAPELPATTLAENCYSSMFSGCTSLTDAPELPATTLAQSCYSEMFYGCTSLTDAPELPATALAQSCYSEMFYGCTSLTDAPELPATTLADNCYSHMFRECTNLTSAPNLPATTLTESCYACMFYNCWSLTSAPELPATTLARYCYSGMFYTTSLTRAPDLPARTLSEYCYQLMFAYCRELQHVKCLATDISANACLYKWVNGVASTGTFVKAPGMNDWPAGASGIPEGWTVNEAE